MTDPTLIALRQMLLDRYDVLTSWLTRRLGSADRASDAVQDAWLRLAHAQAIGPVRSPKSYLYRIVYNVARNHQDADHRYSTAVKIDATFDLADEAPDPAKIAEMRSELRALEAVMAELPERQREILLAARLDNMPLQEIADRLGISLRLVSKELQLAHEYCFLRLSRTSDK
jgi:RNA polymerase sigma-70 factor (ECF subfamily)